MFWSDPNLYGLTLPYKEMTPPMAMSPWGTFPRYVPPPFGFVPPYVNVAPPAFTPFVRPETLTPFVRPEMLSPYLKPEIQPPVAFNPYLTPYHINLPLYNWIRPFGF
jgi:hypothetical protein